MLWTILATTYDSSAATIITGEELHLLPVTIDSPDFIAETVKLPLQNKNAIRVRQNEPAGYYEKPDTPLPLHPLLRKTLRRTKRTLVYSCGVKEHYMPITVSGCARVVKLKICMGSCPLKDDKNKKFCHCRQSQSREVPINFNCPNVKTTISVLSAEHCTCCCLLYTSPSPRDS